MKIKTALIVAAIAAAAANTSSAMTGGSVDQKFRGTWVPAKATCDSPLKVTVEANTVTFVNGTEHAAYPKLEQCFTCSGGNSSVVWLTTDAMGDSPFTLFLDGSKKQPAVQADFSNDKKLAARFPLGSNALKKCK